MFNQILFPSSDGFRERSFFVVRKVLRYSVNHDLAATRVVNPEMCTYIMNAVL